MSANDTTTRPSLLRLEAVKARTCLIHDAWVQEGAKAIFYSERTPPPKDPQYKVRTFEFHPEGAPDALCVVQLDGFRSISCFRTR
ncbi:hypothetical protein V5F40_13420 [Xanthobacter sp. DSM 14520]|uniref:hypothetical protein n=1 Tax=Xanthobacter autotrophicus (strain ATCC BAA-1158 / Py2) TaxID=78245 RepID=UPI00372BE284